MMDRRRKMIGISNDMREKPARTADSSRLEAIVRDLIAHSHEEEWFEFKTNWITDHEIGEYISALSNAAALVGQDAGYLVWGIENNTHRVIGTTFDYHRDVKNEPLQHYLARNTLPDIGFAFRELILQGQRIVVLMIPAAQKTPVSFDEVRYMRIGSSKVKLTKYPDHESQLYYVLRNGLPSIENTESAYQDLTFNKLFVYYESKGITLNRRTFKKNLGLLTESGKYNLLAQLLSDDSRIPIRFALFAGNDKTSTMYSVREFGNTCMLYSLDDVLRYGDLLNIPQADERNRIVERKEIPLFSQEAYREAVINAFVHNSWIDGNAPMFTGFHDRLEILSRGKLPPRQTVEGFFAGESIPVNPALSRIFIQLHITEHTGRGVPKIIQAYSENNIRFNENSITVTIPYNRLGGYAQVTGQVTGQVDGQVTGQVKVEEHESQMINVVDSILQYCLEPKGLQEITKFLGFKNRKSTVNYLKPLIISGRIAMTIPDKPNSSKQKYITIK